MASPILMWWETPAFRRAERMLVLGAPQAAGGRLRWRACREDSDREPEQERQGAIEAATIEELAAQPNRVQKASNLDCGVSPLELEAEAGTVGGLRGVAAGARTARGSRVREVEHRQGMALQSVLAQRGSPGRAPLHGAPAGGRRSLEASHSAFGRQRVRRESSRWHMGGWPGKAIATPVLMLEHVVVLRWLLRTGLTAYAGGGGMVRHAVFLAGHVRVVSCGEHMSVDGICGLPE